MRNLRVVVVLLAIVSVSSVASASPFMDDFESYAAGSALHSQGGWKAWDNDPFWGAPASNAQAYSGSISAEIGGLADLVHELEFTGGNVEVSAMQYIPDGSTGYSYFILLNEYSDLGPYDWSVQLGCDMDAGQIISLNGVGETADIVYDKWVELRFVIDLAANTVDEYYDGNLLSSHAWDMLNYSDTLQCIDLFGNGASPIYYDDITVVPEPATLSLLCLGGLALLKRRA